MKIRLTLMLCLVVSMAFAQTNHQLMSIDSKLLSEERVLKVALPAEYDEDKTYPVIYITDGNSPNFDVALNYLNSLSNPLYNFAPPSILVGIVQKRRNEELDVWNRESGRQFSRFLFEEVVPFMDSNYNTSGFNAMIGHSNGAEYNQYLLLQEGNPFRAFISISTNFNTDLKPQLIDFWNSFNGNPIYYFVANGDFDAPSRIVAGNDFEKLVQVAPNKSIKFSKQTYPGNHNSVVPLSLLDGLRHIFQDYNNVAAYPTFKDYSKNYKADLMQNYGLLGQYRFSDLDTYSMDIIMNRKVEEYEQLTEFVEKHKLWFNYATQTYGGLDAVNRANHYVLMKKYDKGIALYQEALANLDIINPNLFNGNLNKAILAFQETDRIDEGIDFLVASRKELGEDYALIMNYRIAKLSLEHKVSMREGKKALAYCKKHYRENRLFSMEDLNKMEE